MSDRNALRNVTTTQCNALYLISNTSHIEEEEEKEGGDVLADIRPLPDEKRSNWYSAYEFWHGGAFPSRRHGSQFDKWINAGQMTHELVVAVMERGLRRRAANLLGWMNTVLAGLVPYGITTPEEWAAFEQQRKEEDSGRTTGGTGTPPEAPQGPGPGRERQPPRAAEAPRGRAGRDSKLSALAIK